MAGVHNGAPGRLRELRRQRAWTQQDVADRLDRLAQLLEGTHVGVTADMVSKWERGEKRPSALYVRLLAELFYTSPAALDLLIDDAAGDTKAGPAVAGDRLLDMLDLPGGTPAVVQLLLPKMLELGRQELLNRRQLLQAMGVAPAAVGMDALGLTAVAPVVPSSNGGGGRHLDRLRDATRELEVLYHSADPRRLIMPVNALSLSLDEVIQQAREASRRRLALSLLGRAHLLAGRIALFDVRRPLEARAHLDLAREAAQEAGDAVLTSVSFGHMAFLPAMKRNYSASASYLAAARSSTPAHRSALIRSWLYAVEGEINTWARSYDLGRRVHDKARGLIGIDCDAPEWFDFFDEARLAGFEGYTRRAAGDHAGARAALTAAMASPAPMSPKQRTVLTIDFAAACIAQGDVEEGCRRAGQAADDLRRVPYATGIERLRDLQRAIPAQRHPAVRALNDQAADLTEGPQ